MPTSTTAYAARQRHKTGVLAEAADLMLKTGVLAEAADLMLKTGVLAEAADLMLKTGVLAEAADLMLSTAGSQHFTLSIHIPKLFCETRNTPYSLLCISWHSSACSASKALETRRAPETTSRPLQREGGGGGGAAGKASLFLVV